MNIEVTDRVLDAHIEQLESAISSQFLGRAHGFTEEEVGIIQRHLIDEFADVSSLRVYDDYEHRRNQMSTESSVDTVRENFLEMINSGGTEATAFFEKLSQSGISSKKIERLQRHPQLLHPQKLSIKQMATLIERKNHLQGFVELRKELQNLDTSKLTKEEISAQRDLILKHIDHVPISSREKRKLLQILNGSDTKELLNAIAKVQLLVGGDKIKWNTLALSMYPTMAAMHAVAKKKAGSANKTEVIFGQELSWGSKDYNKTVEAPLRQEISEREKFLQELQG
jgi:hypothetical protein